jgi:hypothetical protein
LPLKFSILFAKAIHADGFFVGGCHLEAQAAAI